MGKTERFYKIETMIRHRGVVSFDDLQRELEVSAATLKRDLQYLRDRLNAPIEYDRLSNGYKLVEDTRGHRHELPGLWFSENELYSLLAAQQLLSGLDADGVLASHVKPLQDRIRQLLDRGAAEPRDLTERIKIVGVGRRPVPSRFFELVGAGLMKRLRLRLRYHSRARQSHTARVVSPQRLVHYRSTWYLDAWCHDSAGLRRFALDAVEDAELLESRAHDVPLADIERALDGGYGVFTGGQVQWAILRFAAEAARWVSREEWHVEQRSEWLPDGRYELRVPYADATELAMDVMRHGDQVEVMPDSGTLFEVVAARLRGAAAMYGGPAGPAPQLQAPEAPVTPALAP